MGNTGLFVGTLVLARELGPTGRGTMAFVMVSALVLARVCAFGLDDSASVFLARRVEQRPALLANTLAFFAVSGLVCGAAAVAALLALGSSRPEGVGGAEVAAVGLGTVSCAFLVAGYGVLIGLSRFRWQAAGTALAPWAYAVVLGLLLLVDELTVETAALSWALSIALWAGVLLAGAVRGVGLAKPEGGLLRESLRFGFAAWGSGLFRFLTFRADQLLIAFLATEATLGVYAVAVNTSEVLLYLPTAAATALLPALSREVGGAVALRTVRVFRGVLVVSAVLVALVALVAPSVVPFVFGREFAAAVAPLLWLLPGAFGFAALAIFSSALVASGKPLGATRSSFVALAVGVALDLVLIPRFGASGAAFAASAAFTAGGVVAVHTFRRASGFPLSALVPRPSDGFELVALASSVVRRAGA